MWELCEQSISDCVRSTFDYSFLLFLFFHWLSLCHCWVHIFNFMWNTVFLPVLHFHIHIQHTKQLGERCSALSHSFSSIQFAKLFVGPLESICFCFLIWIYLFIRFKIARQRATRLSDTENTQTYLSIALVDGLCAWMGANECECTHPSPQLMET